MTVAASKEVTDQDLPELRVRREMLEQEITGQKRQAFSFFINAEFVAAQGLDPETKKIARKQAADINAKRKNLLKGVARLAVLLAELPEPEPEEDEED